MQSAVYDLKKVVGSFNTYGAGLSYIFSSYVFMFLYMFTSDQEDHLGITIEGR